MMQLFEPFGYFFKTGLFHRLEELTYITGGSAALLSLIVSFVCVEIAIVFAAFYARAGRRLDFVFAAQALFGSLLNLVAWAIFSTDQTVREAAGAVRPEILEESAFWVRMQYALAFLVLGATLRFVREALQWRLPRPLLQAVYVFSPLCALFCFSSLFQTAEPRLREFYALNEGEMVKLSAEPEGPLFYPFVIALFGSFYILLFGILRAVNRAHGTEARAYAYRRRAIVLGLLIMCGLASVDVIFAVKQWTLTSLPHLYTMGWGLFCILAAGALFKEMVHERELRRQVRQAQEQTEQSIAGGMAHEIKNALGSPMLVLGDAVARALIPQSQKGLANLVQVLERHQQTLGDDFQQALRPLESVQDALTELQETILLSLTEVQRGINVTDLVLDLAKIESRVTHEPVDLNIIVKQVVSEETRAHSDVAFHFERAGTARACGNPYLFRSLVRNLLANAVDALQSKRDIADKAIRVRTAMEEREGRRHCLLEVQDNGIGIKPEHLDLIFDPFFSTKASRGTGLGLNLVQRIVDRYEGEIEVESQEGVGTTFRVHLPESHAADHARRQTTSVPLTSGRETQERLT